MVSSVILFCSWDVSSWASEDISITIPFSYTWMVVRPPLLSMVSRVALSRARPSDTITTMEAVPIITPSIVRNVRSFLRHRLLKLILIRSQNLIGPLLFFPALPSYQHHGCRRCAQSGSRADPDQGIGFLLLFHIRKGFIQKHLIVHRSRFRDEETAAGLKSSPVAVLILV